jgi:hypothetical protein
MKTVAVALVVLAIGVVALDARRAARIWAGLAAKQTCSCVFVDGRDQAACLRDLPPATDGVQVAVDREAGSVRARSLLADRIARHRDGSGCALQ